MGEDMKFILKILKRIVVSGFTIYALNIMIRPLNLILPINIITLSFVSIFGVLAIPFFLIFLIYFL